MALDKINTTEDLPQSILEKMIEKGRKMNEGKVSLRINNNTVIKVKPENANEAYRQAYIVKHRIRIYN